MEYSPKRRELAKNATLEEIAAKSRRIPLRLPHLKLNPLLKLPLPRLLSHLSLLTEEERRKWGNLKSLPPNLNLTLSSWNEL